MINPKAGSKVYMYGSVVEGVHVGDYVYNLVVLVRFTWHTSQMNPCICGLPCPPWQLSWDLLEVKPHIRTKSVKDGERVAGVGRDWSSCWWCSVCKFCIDRS